MIQKVLVANRGEIALRIFRTCNQLGLTTVAVYSEADFGEPHSIQADSSILLPGRTAAETYLNIDAVIAAAKDSGADALHPGYGFLSENAEFARAVADAGITWIGPTPESMCQMGSKLRAKEIMDTAGVPTLPGGALTGLSDDEISKLAEAIGYPVLVKASAGGGGKGMRVVTDPVDLEESVATASREALSSFGDGTVFLEKYLSSPRHIEIQVFGDTHSNFVSLFERECSIQRRHQKIIEESPSPVVDESLRQRIGDAAVRAAEAVDYVGAGTVEFLLQNGDFFFLEMNTRLQVEHPVTEMVTGLDLVELQIIVANGEPLPPAAITPTMNGHAIEARVYAEDPAHEFLPVTGQVHTFAFDGTVRVDSGVGAGSNVSVFYDPMLAKVIAHAPSRDLSIPILSQALRAARIHAATTNRDLLVRILEDPDFRSGEFDTHFLQDDDRFDRLVAPLASSEDELDAARAVALADQALAREKAPVLSTLPSGWRNLAAVPQKRSYSGTHGDHDVTYSIIEDRVKFSDSDTVDLFRCRPGHVEFEMAAGPVVFEIARYGQIRFVDTAQTSSRLEVVDRFPSSANDEKAGSLHSPMPGKVIRVNKEVGETVAEGEVILVLEAMKMEHAIRSPHDGKVEAVAFVEGDQVDAGSVLAVVYPADDGADPNATGHR